MPRHVVERSISNGVADAIPGVRVLDPYFAR